MAAENLVTITERGGALPRLIELDDIVCSWHLNEAGAFSAFTTASVLRRAGLYDDLEGRWLTYEHPTAGPWGGVITIERYRGQEAELAAYGWPILLKRRRASASQRALTGPAGALFRHVITEAAREEPTFIEIGDTDESGDFISLDVRSEDLYDSVLGRFTALGQWTVTPDRVARFARRIGRDRTATCRLVEGIHIEESGSTEWLRDMALRTNDLLVFGADGDPENAGRQAASARVRDATSMQRFGPLESTATYSQTRSAGTLVALARAAIAELAEPWVSLPLTVLDVDGAWAKFREGDEVMVELGQMGREVRYRVDARALSVTEGTMTLSGTARELGRTFLGAGQ